MGPENGPLNVTNIYLCVTTEKIAYGTVVVGGKSLVFASKARKLQHSAPLRTVRIPSSVLPWETDVMPR